MPGVRILPRSCARPRPRFYQKGFRQESRPSQLSLRALLRIALRYTRLKACPTVRAGGHASQSRRDGRNSQLRIEMLISLNVSNISVCPRSGPPGTSSKCLDMTHRSYDGKAFLIRFNCLGRTDTRGDSSQPTAAGCLGNDVEEFVQDRWDGERQCRRSCGRAAD